MQSWHTTYLGLKDLLRELSAFELQAFFTFSRAERTVIDARYGATHKLGLALHMGFLRLSGRSLNGCVAIASTGPTKPRCSLKIRMPSYRTGLVLSQ
jgi:hypothetical protein